MKRIYVEERTIRTAKYMIKTGCTIRQAAAKFGVPKSTTYTDISERLQWIDVSLFYECRKVLDHNKSVRHLRGGQATQDKFKHLKAIHR